jgi:hypothetical protein
MLWRVCTIFWKDSGDQLVVKRDAKKSEKLELEKLENSMGAKVQ